MSLVFNVMAQVEVVLRGLGSLSTLPVGSDGVEYGWRPVHQLKTEELPHVFLFDEQETREPLIFQQQRVSISFRGLIVRRENPFTLVNAATDYEGLSADLEADPTVNGVVEQSTITLDGFEREEGKSFVVCAFSFSGIKVL